MEIQSAAKNSAPLKTKEQLKAEILQKRDALSQIERDTRSTIVALQFLGTEAFKGAKTIFTYASYGSEVSTNYILWKAPLLGKKICVPKVNLKTSEMWPVKISGLKSLKPNSIGIPEPSFWSLRAEPKEVDIILVPGTVFDMRGHRIGSGKGFYDKYLTAHKNNATAIGLAYDFQVVNELPDESHDVRVDKIITEKRIINCQ